MLRAVLARRPVLASIAVQAEASELGVRQP